VSAAFGIKKMRVETRESPVHGTGVFAAERIPRGEVVLSIDDSRIVDDEHPMQEALGEKPDHCDYLPDGTTVLMATPEHYINHSCDPNVFAYSVCKRRFAISLRDIAAEEEILWDYSIGAVGGDVWTCRCGASNCRGLHKCDFFALPEQRQLEYLPFLDPWFAQLHEPRILDLLRRRAEPLAAGEVRQGP